MRTITVTLAGQVLLRDAEGEEDGPTGDPAFLAAVMDQQSHADYSPDPFGDAAKVCAERIGATFEQVGELEDIPDDAVA